MADDLVALRMNGYYYGFSSTGVRDVDRILSAIACAGKAYHHTEHWLDECDPYPGHEGNSPADWIQRAARHAADTIARLTVDNEDLKEKGAYFRNETLIARAARDKAEAENARLRALLTAIFQAARTDERGERWTLRRWLDDRDLYSEDLSSLERLIELAYKHEFAALKEHSQGEVS